MSTIEDLLSSAERIAHFGVQSGRITDTRLLAAISDARTAKANNGLTSGGPEAVALASAVQEAARMISPTTVAELSRGWNPFATPPTAPAPVARNLATWATLVGTVVLVFAAGYYTLWHKRATDLMTFVVDEAVKEQEDAVMDMMLPMLAQLPAVGDETRAAASEPGRNPLQVAMLLKDVERIQEMQRSISFFENRFDSLYRDRIILWGQLLDVRDWIWKPQEEDLNEDSTTLAGAASAQPTAKSIEGAATPQDNGPVQDKQDIFPVACGTPGALDIKDAGAQVFEVLQAANLLSGIDDLRSCLMTVIDVEPLTEDNLQQVRLDLYGFDHALSVVGSWLLPAIYGALGALIYYMRQFLDPLRQDPPFERVVIRVSLGAFAGITVGWFFTPTTVAQGFQIPDVGMAMLTFAFILGFSIEVFFGFLERLVNLSNDGIARLGKPS
ncbi:MAG: hypothetical protein H0T41_02565 [Rhodobacteraceae bacterium]|nr:hypothetical protein [Paracoccaceae bacterium]